MQFGSVGVAVVAAAASRGEKEEAEHPEHPENAEDASAGRSSNRDTSNTSGTDDPAAAAATAAAAAAPRALEAVYQFPGSEGDRTYVCCHSGWANRSHPLHTAATEGGGGEVAALRHTYQLRFTVSPSPSPQPAPTPIPTSSRTNGGGGTSGGARRTRRTRRTGGTYADAVESVWRRAWSEAAPAAAVHAADLDKVYADGIALLGHVAGIYNGVASMPFRATLPEGVVDDPSSQMGFVGKALAAAAHLLRGALATNNTEWEAHANAIVNFWVDNSMNPSGQPKTWYNPPDYHPPSLSGSSGGGGSKRTGSGSSSSSSMSASGGSTAALPHQSGSTKKSDVKHQGKQKPRSGSSVDSSTFKWRADSGYMGHLRIASEGAQGVLTAWKLAGGSGAANGGGAGGGTGGATAAGPASWLQFAQQYGDFLVAKQSAADGSIAGEWKWDGSAWANFTNVGDHPIPFLIELSAATGDAKYAAAAVNAGKYSWNAMKASYQYIGGACDNPNVLDKEAGVLALKAFLALHSHDQDPVWIEAARQAATYSETWTYSWDIPIPSDDPGVVYPHGRTTLGASLIASGQSGADNFMAIATYDYYKLYLLTNESHFRDFAYFLEAATKQILDWYDDGMPALLFIIIAEPRLGHGIAAVGPLCVCIYTCVYSAAAKYAGSWLCQMSQDCALAARFLESCGVFVHLSCASNLC